MFHLMLSLISTVVSNSFLPHFFQSLSPICQAACCKASSMQNHQGAISSKCSARFNQASEPCPNLYVAAVVSSRRQLDAPESDWTLERHFDGRLLHAVLPVESGAARRGRHTAEIPLDWKKRDFIRIFVPWNCIHLVSNVHSLHFIYFLIFVQSDFSIDVSMRN